MATQKKTAKTSGKKSGKSITETKKSTTSKKTKTSKKEQLKKKRKKRRILFAIEALFLIIVIPLLFFYYKIGQIPTYDMSGVVLEQNEYYDRNISEYTNIALFGVDSRANELTEKTRTDCIIIASINNTTKEVKLSSIYRDTFVYIKDHGYTKLNHAYAYGGPALAISTLNKNLDLSITDFATINFSALSNVIDALGGIEIEITEDELKYVNAYAKDVAKINGTTVEKIPSAGLQTLNGTQATGYCRVRYTSGGDFTRAQRQRTVIEQIVKKAKSSNPVKLYNIMNEILPQIYTSLDTNEILKLASGVLSYKITDNFGFPFEKETPTINGASVVTANTLSSNVTLLHEKLFQTDNYIPSSTVEYRSNEIGGFY